VLREALEKDRVTLVAHDYDAVWSFWDKSEAAETTFIESVQIHKPDAS
jgi:hypothetical protein